MKSAFYEHQQLRRDQREPRRFRPLQRSNIELSYHSWTPEPPEQLLAYQEEQQHTLLANIEHKVAQ
jgi:hypothetical protein